MCIILTSHTRKLKLTGVVQRAQVRGARRWQSRDLNLGSSTPSPSGESPCSGATSRGLPASPNPAGGGRSPAQLRAPPRVSPRTGTRTCTRTRTRTLDRTHDRTCALRDSWAKAVPAPRSFRLHFLHRPPSESSLEFSLCIATAPRRLPGLAQLGIPATPSGARCLICSCIPAISVSAGRAT